MQQAMDMSHDNDQAQAPALSRREQRAAAKLAKQIERANKKQSQRARLAASTEFDSTRTEPESFYERAIEWTHRADKIINLVLGYALAIASVLGFMDVLSNGEVLNSIPFAFYAWLLIMGLGVDFQILLVIGRMPDVARMVTNNWAKFGFIVFNIVFLAFLAYVSIIIGAVFTQHRDVPGTIAQAMQALGINSTSFVYERAALATFLLILMGVDRTMERWRMQIAAGNRQQHRDKQQAQVSETEEQIPTAWGFENPRHGENEKSDLAQLVQAMQEMNAQNLAAMQRMNDESMSRFSHVTVELVRETIERTAATVALGSPTQPALPAGHVDHEGEQEALSDASQREQEGEQEIMSALPVDCSGEQETRDYSALIQALYQGNSEITVTEIVDQLGCSRSTAAKWLKRVKPVNA